MGGKNILEARYLAVNRLPSKCIQSLGLNSIGQLSSLNKLTNTVPLPAVLSVRYLKWVPRERKLTESRILYLFAGNTSRKRFLQNRVAIAREKNRRSFA
jgi:hypothetical protein